jgi:hypothetical protein
MKRTVILALFLPVCAYAFLTADVTVVNYFTTPDTLFGLYAEDYHISGIDPFDDEVELYNFDGSPYAQLPLDYTAYPCPWGIVVVPGPGNFYSDFASNYIYYGSSGDWHSFVNPAGIHGRGLDYDGQYLWEADNDYGGDGNGVYRFAPDGTGAYFFPTPEPEDYLSGLTRFSFDGDEYVMVTAQEDYRFFFYLTDGTYAGSASAPFTLSYGYGLDYCDARDTFFFSCVSYGNNCVYELEFDFYVGIEGQSLGEIKASFR